MVHLSWFFVSSFNLPNYVFKSYYTEFTLDIDFLSDLKK